MRAGGEKYCRYCGLIDEYNFSEENCKYVSSVLGSEKALRTEIRISRKKTREKEENKNKNGIKVINRGKEVIYEGDYAILIVKKATYYRNKRNVLKMIEIASEQNCMLSYEDIAVLTGKAKSTIARHIRENKERIDKIKIVGSQNKLNMKTGVYFKIGNGREIVKNIEGSGMQIKRLFNIQRYRYVEEKAIDEAEEFDRAMDKGHYRDLVENCFTNFIL